MNLTELFTEDAFIERAVWKYLKNPIHISTTSMINGILIAYYYKISSHINLVIQIEVNKSIAYMDKDKAIKMLFHRYGTGRRVESDFLRIDFLYRTNMFPMYDYGIDAMKYLIDKAIDVKDSRPLFGLSFYEALKLLDKDYYQKYFPIAVTLPSLDELYKFLCLVCKHNSNLLGIVLTDGNRII